MKKSALLLTAAVGLLFTACTKSGSSGPSAAEQKLYGKWRMTYSKSFVLDNGEVVAEFNLLNLLDSCGKDDLTDFRPDHSFWMDQGNLKCFPFLPQEVRRGGWMLQNNDQELVFTQDSTHAVLSRSRVLELSASRLKLYADSTTGSNGDSVSAKLITIYEKQ